MSAPEGYHQVNKFEQVCSLGHNMSIALVGVRRGSCTKGEGSLYIGR